MAYRNRLFMPFVLLLFVTAYNAPVYATEIIDVNNLDLTSWKRLQEDLQEQGRTRRQIGYYSLGKANIDFRSVLESDNETQAEWLTHRAGEKYLVAKSAVIKSNDIEDVLIEKTSSKGQDYFSITIYFRRESWNKVYSASRSLLKHNVALVKDGLLFSVAPNIDAFINQATFSGQYTTNDIELFSKGLVVKDRPLPEARDREYTEWLEAYLKHNSNDIGIMSDLARQYNGYRSALRDCDKSAVLAERISHADVSQLDDSLYTLYCFRTLKQYDKAEKFYKSIPLNDHAVFLSRSLSDSIEIRTAMGEIYVEKGEWQKAITEFEKNLSALEAAVVSIPPDIRNYDADNYLATVTNFKQLQIINMKEAIDKMKKALK